MLEENLSIPIYSIGGLFVLYVIMVTVVSEIFSKARAHSVSNAHARERTVYAQKAEKKKAWHGVKFVSTKDLSGNRNTKSSFKGISSISR
mgnify:CR=1 FL=1